MAIDTLMYEEEIDFRYSLLSQIYSEIQVNFALIMLIALTKHELLM